MAIKNVVKKLFPEVGGGATEPIYPILGFLVVGGYLALSWAAIWFQFTLFRFPRLTYFVVGLFALYVGAWVFRRRHPNIKITDDFQVHIRDGSCTDRQAFRQGLESLLAFTILLSIACLYLGGLI